MVMPYYGKTLKESCRSIEQIIHSAYKNFHLLSDKSIFRKIHMVEFEKYSSISLKKNFMLYRIQKWME